jgi:hypothetical protein
MRPTLPRGTYSLLTIASSLPIGRSPISTCLGGFTSHPSRVKRFTRRFTESHCVPAAVLEFQSFKNDSFFPEGGY